MANKVNWQAVYEGLCTCIEEDAKVLEAMVADDDSCCIARALRQERAATLRYVLALADTAKRWEYA